MYVETLTKEKPYAVNGCNNAGFIETLTVEYNTPVKSPLSIHISIFDSIVDTIPKEFTPTWEQFCYRVKNPFVKADKKASPLFSATIYGETKARSNKNVDYITALVIEYDHKASFSNDLNPFMDYEFVAHTTHSHLRSTNSNPDAGERFRIIIPLKTRIPANKFHLLWQWADKQSGEKIDPQSKDLSHMFYLPAKVDEFAPYEYYVNEGQLLEWESLKLEEQEENLNKLKTQTEQANGFDYSVYAKPTGQFDIRNYIPQLTPNGAISNGWHHYDCPACGGKGKLYVNHDSGGYNCFHKNNNTCGTDQIRQALGKPKQTKSSSNFEIPSIELSKDSSIGTVEEVFSTILSHLPTEVDFKAVADMKKDDRLQMKEYVVICADLLVKTAKALGFDFTIKGNLYVYNTQYWLETDINTVKKEGLIYFLSSAMNRLGIWNVRNQFHTSIDHLCSQFLTRVLFDQYIPKRTDKILINLSNGTYDFKERKLRDFDKDDFLTYQLSFPFDPNAVAPKWEKFLDKVLPSDDTDSDGSRQKVLAEYVGSAFTNLKTEKMLFNYGSGGNGKTVVMDVISALVGAENVCNVSLKNICTQDSFLAQLNNKLINLSSEASDYIDAQLIKDLASKEVITVCRKYEHPFEMINYARILINANELPRKGKEFLGSPGIPVVMRQR